MINKGKKITILVIDIKTTIRQNNNLKKSKYITCPKCNDAIKN